MLCCVASFALPSWLIKERGGLCRFGCFGSVRHKGTGSVRHKGTLACVFGGIYGGRLH